MVTVNARRWISAVTILLAVPLFGQEGERVRTKGKKKISRAYASEESRQALEAWSEELLALLSQQPVDDVTTFRSPDCAADDIPMRGRPRKEKEEKDDINDVLEKLAAPSRVADNPHVSQLLLYARNNNILTWSGEPDDGTMTRLLSEELKLLAKYSPDFLGKLYAYLEEKPGGEEFRYSYPLTLLLLRMGLSSVQRHSNTLMKEIKDLRKKNRMLESTKTDLTNEIQLRDRRAQEHSEEKTKLETKLEKMLERKTNALARQGVEFSIEVADLRRECDGFRQERDALQEKLDRKKKRWWCC